LSYTTIESRGAIDVELRDGHADRLFGCDICQEVCPWNRRRGRRVPDDPLGLRARLRPRPEWLQPSLRWILELDEARWRQATKGTALRRSKYRGLLRNALIVAGNSGCSELLPLIGRWADSDDALVAEHARWARSKLAAEAGDP
jgi:epoxyqueuosine reductase